MVRTRHPWARFYATMENNGPAEFVQYDTPRHAYLLIPVAHPSARLPWTTSSMDFPANRIIDELGCIIQSNIDRIMHPPYNTCQILNYPQRCKQ